MSRLSIMAVAATAFLLSAGAVQAQGRLEVGVLSCRGGEVRSYILGSDHHLRCVFRGRAGMRQRYTGVIRRVGIDVGVVRRSALVWTVLAPTRVVGPGELAGTYVGASAGAAVGVGGGANVLVGGSNRSITLQPVSVEAQTGLNIAIGFAGLELRPL